MTKILSREVLSDFVKHYCIGNSALIACAESMYAKCKAAVLEAQGKQEPAAFIETVNPRDGSFRKSLVWKKHPKPSSAWCTEYTPLYAAPVVQPGMVMVPMEAFDRLSSTGEECEFNDMASMCFPLDEWSDFEAMIAAAEGKK